jgi:hypothetical protein
LQTAVSFLAGAPEHQAARYWVPSEELANEYNARVGQLVPGRGGLVRYLSTEQVEEREGRLRPVSDVTDFVEANPRGVTAAGETLSAYLNRDNIDAHLEYEAWFDALPRDDSRFLCPYDLRRLPVDQATEVLRSLGSHHNYVVLSRSTDPPIRLLQLFVFEKILEIPEPLEGTLGWAIRSDAVDIAGSPKALKLTRHGDEMLEEWGDRTWVG